MSIYGGRFIPCRGGRTATTYYTDAHIVDEDMTAVSVVGGAWVYENMAGITIRELNNDSTSVGSTNAGFNVASRLIYLS